MSSLQVSGTQVAFERPVSTKVTVTALDGWPAPLTVTLDGDSDRLPETRVVPPPPQLPSGLLALLTVSELLSARLRAIWTVCCWPPKVQRTETVA